MASCRLVQQNSFGSNHGLVMEGWEAKENQDGVVYFVNNELKITSWIHPYVNKIFEDLGDYNDIRYAAYRTALKLRSVQKKLGLSWISIKSIKTVFSNSSVNEDGSGSEDVLSCREVFKIVHNVMEISDYLRLHRDHLLKASETILNLLLELYDTNRSGKLAKRSIKVALVALCSAKLSDKYRFFFDEISNDKGHIQREKFLYLIHDLMQITELMKESTAFGTNVSAAVNSCLSAGSSNERSQDVFYSWLLREPQTLVWLPTLHRVIATENVQHNVQCCACRTQPFVGFRYRCMQCLNYDLCQTCFFNGCISQSHRLKHPMREYCFPLTLKDNTKALLKIMRNKVSRKHRQSKIKFLPVDDDSITGSVFQWQPRSMIPDPRDSFCSSTDSGLAVGSGSREVTESDQLDDNVAMMKKWYKPLEVLGEPYDTSSPCLQQENLSKKNMDIQQLKMAQTIQQLQEENRLLRQRLTAFRKREIDDDDDEEEQSCHLSEDIVVVKVGEKNLAGDPLKEITTDEPISPIQPSSNTDRQPSTDNTFAANEKFEPNDKQASADILDIIGRYTPIPSSFHMDNKTSSNSSESGVNAEEVQTDEISTSSGISKNRIEKDCLTESEDTDSMKGEWEPQNDFIRNKPVFAFQENTDTETETTSNELEYTYSDMSLKSEASSRPRSNKSGHVALRAEERTNEVSTRKVDPILTPDSTMSYNTSAYISPDTTKNETSVELDAFRLCRMKFDTSNKPHRHNSTRSEPHLIYSSSSKNKDHHLRSASDDFRPDSFQASKIMIYGENSVSSPLNLNSVDFASFDLSEIPAQGSNVSFPNAAKCLTGQPPCGPSRRQTLEPVFMSTPVTGKTDFVPRKSALRKRSASAKMSGKREGKENKVPVYGHDSTSDLLNTKGSLSYKMTPASAIPPWQQQRILFSVDGVQSNRSYSCNDLSTGGEMGMTTMFDRAEHHRTTGAGCNSLPLEDKKELERMIEKVGIGESHYSELPACGNVSDSSMLQAVMNIGDAMADFVQATAEVHLQKESTNL